MVQGYIAKRVGGQLKIIAQHILLGGADLLKVSAIGLMHIATWMLRGANIVRSVAEDDE